jgi:hypothetical protein
VQVAPEHARTNGLPEGEPFEIGEVKGLGDDAFVRLRDRNGRVVPRWYRATELLPARLTLDPSELPRVVEDDREDHMSEAAAAPSQLRKIT